jgi:hypothetical protein
MANTTFDGPIRSRNGFQSIGPGSFVNLTADTSLTVAAHAGRIMLTNDADGKFTLPTIISTGGSNNSGPGRDPNNPNTIGTSFKFFVETAATDMDIKTDGTDKFVGAVTIGINNSDYKAFAPVAANDVITMNGTTKGGIVGSIITITAIDALKYMVSDCLLIGSGTIVTPFANA